MEYSLATAAGAVLYQIYYLDALTDIVTARDGNRKATKYKSSMKKLEFYGKDAPENVENKIHLIEAELAMLKYGKSKRNRRRKKDDAISKFKQSIEEGKRQGILFEEAFAYERFAIATLEWGDIPQALEYFERAKSLYERWGSPVKVTQLTELVKDKTGVTMTP